jgi:2-polyprenyl-6-methoxyphenol hydroxylase-like FAD-dependent oxidoreductase
MREAIAARMVPSRPSIMSPSSAADRFGFGRTGSPATCGTILSLMSLRSVLVVGAGIAGSTLAVLLARGGVSITVVERAGQRSMGGPVDVRGAALEVVARLGLLDSLRAAATEVTRLAAVDPAGRVIGWIPTQTSPDAIEVARSDLASILIGAVGAGVEILYGDTVVGLDDDGAGVEVRFERATPRRFDLVVGADGLHSQVRRIAFGAEHRFTRPLGMYIATTPLGTTAPDLHTVFLHGVPGRAAMIHPTTGREGAAFIFRHRSPIQPGDAVDRHLRNRLLTGAYARMGWRVPEMLDHIRGAEDVYFDSINRVEVGYWSRNRVVLVGDAAGCVTVFGEGSSMAIAGAATLAQAVASSTDLTEALRWYERAHRRRLAARHRGAGLTGHFLVPASRAGLAIRDGAFRIWPTISAVSGRRAAPV